MLSRVMSAAVQGIDSYLITVEVDIAPGLPMFSTVGLPDAAVKESKDRVVAAIRNSGFDVPSKRITVNLAPADVKKEGACFDLPIALGILSATDKEPKLTRPEVLAEFCCVGELALDGTLRPVKGVLPIVLGLRRRGLQKIILPVFNADEASVVRDVTVYPAGTLREVVGFINGENEIAPHAHTPVLPADGAVPADVDFSEVKGQQFAKRALEVAAAGGHNVIMVGPPGSGKSMLSRRLPTILPPLSFEEALETTKIHSVVGLLPPGKSLVTGRPFRSPHHTVSNIALIGGGSFPKPGEVSLAHNGVLFLDEMTEFHSDVLDVLRQPLEDRVVTISRARHSLAFPASFMLVGASNACKCGNYGHGEKACVCTPPQIRKYRAKISGPLMDRIDIHLEIPALKVAELMHDAPAAAEPSAAIRERVVAARTVQRARFGAGGIHCNAQMNARLIRKHCGVSRDAHSLLRAAMEKFGFSGRAYDRILKVSRTIADLAGSPDIQQTHIAEAIQYRHHDHP